MIKVGITGGIGSGKTLVCEIFEKLGIPIYYADTKAKYLINTSTEIRQKLIAEFGPEIYDGQQINRKILGDIIFNNTDAVKFVNSVVHPAVAADFAKWAETQTAPYVIEEAALLFESGGNKHMDLMVTVFAPKEIRLQRASLRDSATAAQIEARMANQLPDDNKMAQSHFVIYNNETQSVTKQIITLHNKILSGKWEK